jgi:predicted RNA polymerase sigma factor
MAKYANESKHGRDPEAWQSAVARFAGLDRSRTFSPFYQRSAVAPG